MTAAPASFRRIAGRGWPAACDLHAAAPPRCRRAPLLLEVIESNTRAVALYESLGFTTTRPLTCWKRETGNAVSGVAIRPIEADWGLLSSFLDVAPTWQNSEASIRRARDPRIILRCHIYVTS